MGTLDLPQTPLAAEPLYLLINQHYQVSRQPGAATAMDHDTHDPLWRRCVVAEASLALMLTLVREQIYPPSPETLVPLSERLALELGALEGLLSNGTPIDAVAPRISNQAQRQHVLPAPLVSLLVQTTLFVVLSALADDARLIIVSTPRTAQGGVLVTVEADADATRLDTGINAQIKERVGKALCAAGGELTVTATDRGTWVANICLSEAWNIHTEVRHRAVA
jgi:hypothetical protein